MAPLLELGDVSRSFGGVTAVKEVSFRVPRGAVIGLIGPNGAGKTTLFDLVAGHTSLDRGVVAFDGVDVTHWSPERRAVAGLARTFQIPRPLERMSVWENLMFAAPHQPGERFWSGLFGGRGVAQRESEIRRRADEVLAFVELDHVASDRALSLSGGQRKLLEIARVLMLHPQLILLDEPTAGIAPELRAGVAGRLRDMHQQGVTLLIIEHDLEFVMGLVDELIVMHLGEVIAHGDPEKVRAEATVLEAYLGGLDA